MSNQKSNHEEHMHKTKAEKKIEEIRLKVEEILERLDQIEVDETWMKTWRTRREQKEEKLYPL